MSSSTSFLPKQMQFEPMNQYYENGRNPWSVLHYKERTIVVCGSEKEYEQMILDKNKLPKEIFKYLRQLGVSKVFTRKYPETLSTSMKLIFNNNTNDYDFDYLVDM